MNPRELNRHVAAWLAAHAPALLEDASLLVALPRQHTKKSAEGTYQVERWFWNVRVPAGHALLIALDHAPADVGDVVIAECYRIPRDVVGARKVIARYRLTTEDDRVGSWLDSHRLLYGGSLE